MVFSEHFIQNFNTKTAVCNYCGKNLSFQSTSANLKTHLRLKHKDAYDMLIKHSGVDPSSKLPIKNTRLWEHFVNINPEEMIARCNYCQKDLSYRTSENDLEKHLHDQHEEHFTDSVCEDDPIIVINKEDNNKAVTVTPNRMRSSNNPLWKYFERNQTTWYSKCFLCGNRLSYRSTTSNLKQHLKSKHRLAYDKLCREYKNPTPMNELGSSVSDSEDEDADASLKLYDIWNYFEVEEGKARCVVCRESMNTEYEELKAHLKENHPKLLLQLMQDKDDSDSGSNNGGDNNTYTEIVYLEQEAEEHKDKLKPVPKATPITIRKRERRCSTPDDVPVKQKKNEDNDELTIFIKYITCLLKKLTPEAFSQVQLEIINAILKANSNASTSCVLDNTSHIILNKELPATSGPNILINDVQSGISAPVTNYTITVAPNEDGGEQANS